MINNLDFHPSSTFTLTPENSDVFSNTEITMRPFSNETGTNGNQYDRDVALYYKNTTNPYNGTLYNYYAATATYTYPYDNLHTYGESPTSICPAGWRLPIGTYSGEFRNLYNQYGSVSDYISINGPNFTNNGAYTGQYYSGSGNYWSSTIKDNSLAYIMTVNSSYSTTSDETTNKAGGRSVRCIKSSGSYTIEYNANGGVGQMTPSMAKLYIGGTLSKNTFQRDGYYFNGWSTRQDATTPDYLDGSFLPYMEPDNGSVTVYAVWHKVDKLMQTEDICSSITAGDVSGDVLTDIRDLQDYPVYRFSNTGVEGTDYPAGLSGHCIMSKDLSLGYITSGSIMAGDELVLTNDYSASAGTIIKWPSSGSAGGFTAYMNGPDTNDSNNTKHSYYDYLAAQKVCPKGWKVPSKSEYNNIISFLGGSNSTGVSNITNAPYNFKRNGYYNAGWSGVNSYGSYWASSTENWNMGDFLMVEPSGLSVPSYNRTYARSVRCISE